MIVRIHLGNDVEVIARDDSNIYIRVRHFNMFTPIATIATTAGETVEDFSENLVNSVKTILVKTTGTIVIE